MTSRQFVLFARTNNSQQNSLSTYASSISADSPRTLADAAVQYHLRNNVISPATAVDFERIQHLSESFHRRIGTLTPAVQDNIRSLHPHNLLLRFSHQINLFPSWGVLSQFIFLDLLARELHARIDIPTPQLYIGIDYDIASDNRFRAAHFPDTTCGDGTVTLAGAVPSLYNQRTMYSVPKPPKTLIAHWLSTLRDSIHRNLALLRKDNLAPLLKGWPTDNLDTVEHIVWRAYGLSNTLADFNAIFSSIVVNEYWRCPVAFVFSHELQPCLRKGYTFLLDNEKAIKHHWNQALAFFSQHGIKSKLHPFNDEDTLIWSLCPQCATRNIFRRHSATTFQAECSYCHRKNAFHPGGDYAEFMNISPRIIADDLLDYVSFGMVAGTSYIGAAEHRLMVDYVARQIGLDPAPECLWSPVSLTAGPVELHSSTLLQEDTIPHADRLTAALNWLIKGRATILYYALYTGLYRLRIGLDRTLTSQDVDDIILYEPDSYPPTRSSKELQKLVTLLKAKRMI